MANIPQYVAFVNKQAERLEEIIRKHPDDKRAKIAYRELIAKFKAIAEVLAQFEDQAEQIEVLADQVTALTAELNKRKRSLDDLDISPEDIEGLPPEVLKQLSIGEADLQEFTFLKVIEAAGGTITLDKLIVDLYKATGEVHDRQKLNARLYRMAQAKGMLYSIPNKRGVYSIYKPLDSENEEIPLPRGSGISASATSASGGD